MIKCNSCFGCNNMCVVSMDSFQSQGGNVTCDIAEMLEFDEELILSECEFSEKEELN